MRALLARPRRRASCRRGRRARRRAAGRTCCRRGAISMPSICAPCRPQAAWRIGQAAAERLVALYWQEEGEWPRTVALSAWGTANMRTGGDDIAQALALIGARPVWEAGSGRVTGFAVMPLGGAEAPARRRDLAGLGTVPRRVPDPDRPVRQRGARGRGARRAGRRQPDRRGGARGHAQARRAQALRPRRRERQAVVPRVRREARRLRGRPAGADRRRRLAGPRTISPTPISPGAATPMAAAARAARRATTSPSGSPASSWWRRRRTIASTTFSTATTTISSWADSPRRSRPCAARRRASRISTPRGRRRRSRVRSRRRSRASCAAAPPTRSGSPA